MSKNLPENQPSEEIDLGQLFKLIGNAFDRLFRFIGGIFNKLFLSFVWIVFFTKKHIIKLGLAVVVGVVFGLLKEGLTEPIYKSTVIINQNYDTGEHLNNTIGYYNSLIQNRDTLEVAKVLRITPEEASTMVSLEMESNITENDKLKVFDEFIRDIDSTLIEDVSYKDFTENRNDFNYKIQRLTLKSKIKTNFTQVLTNIIENIENTEYFKWEREKLINNLNLRDSIIYASLEESKTLQEVYKEVLQQPLKELPQGATNIAIGDTQDKSKTKEYELFIKDLDLKRELADNAFERKNYENIIEVISIQNGDGTLENQAKLLGFETSWTIALAVKIFLILYVLLLLFEFVKFLERFRDQVM